MTTNNINHETTDLFLKIKKIDLSEIRKYFIIRQNWTEGRVDKAIEDYRRYLYLTQVVGNVAPTPDVDEIWHRHILYMRKYLSDCRNTFGRIIYHEPLPLEEGLKTKSALCQDEGGDVICHPVYDKKTYDKTVMFSSVVCDYFL